ncbi:MAG: PIN domain-containing protein [Anaerolineae bacterium]|nr:PIN domain-containing protein [Anaerolineae bacterium]
MYLLDTNILLELLLDQERANEVEHLMCSVPGRYLYISEFTLYSLGMILVRRQQTRAFLQIVEDLERGHIECLRLDPADMPAVVEAIQQFGLDFDDAYQYVAAEKHGLTLISFDADFDRTPLGRRTPGQILLEV